MNGFEEMSTAEAVAIFKQIDSREIPAMKKRLAIRTVLKMPTHNGITKDEIIRAFKWRESIK